MYSDSESNNEHSFVGFDWKNAIDFWANNSLDGNNAIINKQIKIKINKMNKIAEYDNLRDEIMRLEKETVSITLYVLSGTLISAGLIASDKSSGLILPLLYQILLIWGLRSYITSTRLRLRVSTYLNVNFEAQIEYLNWEGSNVIFKENEGRLIPKWLIRVSHIFSMLTVLGIIISSRSILLLCNSHELSILNLIILVFLILCHILQVYLLWLGVFKMPEADEYIEKWQKIKP